MSPARLSIGVIALASALARRLPAAASSISSPPTATTSRGRSSPPTSRAPASPAGTTMCLTFDADRVQASPGTLSTSDGSFTHSAMRPLPQLLNDPLSLYTFGEGRIKNLIYAAHTTPPDAGAGTEPDPLLFVSLLQSDDIEVRVVRGAPELGDAVAPPGAGTPVFAVFPLSRKPGPCTY